MPDRPHPRLGWDGLPERLREGVERLLGDHVVRAESQRSGMSAGSADVVTTRGGKRYFVKADDADVNGQTVELHRREHHLLSTALYGLAVAPASIGGVEHGAWFALVTEAVDGEQPALPPTREQTIAVLDAIAALGAAPAGLPALSDDLREIGDAWAGLGDLVGEALARRLGALASGAPAVADGTDLVHGDLRLDNVLIVDDVLIARNGTARFVDWSSATRGAAWFDGFTYLLDARRLGADHSDGLIATHPLFSGVPPQAVDALLADFAGYFLARGRLDPPPGLPALRPFQRDQGAATLAWLTARRPDLGIPPHLQSPNGY